MLKYIETSYPDLTKDIATRKQITPETAEKLKQALQTFNSSWVG
jgi:F-type H+-transporting ATPase subunit alpha